MVKVHDTKTFMMYLVVAVVIVGAINFISRDLFFRLDFTDNKMYSLSESSKRVVEKIDDRLTMKVYFTDNLPGQYGNNRRYLQDILEEYEAYSGGNIRFEFYQPESEARLGEEALKYGIQPVQLQVIENDNLEVKRVHMGMVILYGDERGTIPIIQTTTGLEYDITTQIKKLVDTQKRAIAFATIGEQEVEIRNVSQTLRESYDIRTVPLNAEIPANISLLLINGVEDSLSAEEMTRLKAFVGRGGNLFLAQSRISSDLQSQRGTPIKSNIFGFIEGLGLRLKENLVLDKWCNSITVTQTRRFLRFNTQMEYPFFPVIRNFGDHLTVNGLEQVSLLYPSEIGFSDTSSASLTIPLLGTSDRSGLMTGFFHLSPMQNPIFNSLNEPGKVVGALATVKSDSSATLSQVILVSDSQFFSDSGGGVFPENFVFVANAVDFLMGDSDLVGLRSREITTRPLEIVEDAEKLRWKWANILLPPVLIVAYGFFRWKRERNRAKVLEEIYG